MFCSLERQCTLIIHGENSSNIASWELVEERDPKMEKHPNAYQIAQGRWQLYFDEFSLSSNV